MEPAEVKILIERNLTYGEVRRLLVKLVQMASPQTELLEREPKVLALIRDLVNPELDEAGIPSTIDDQGNLVATLRSGQGGRGLLLVSYGMNAAPTTMENPYSGAIVDGENYGIQGECVWGRGACEQKGSLAAMLAALRMVAKSGAELPGPVYFVTSAAGETGRHDSLAHVLDHAHLDAEWGVVDGPPEITLGNKGRVDIFVVVRGKPSHSSRPWEGVNAIEGARKVLERVQALMPYPSEKEHPHLGRVTLAPTSIESFPKATHTIQSECRILFDRRLLPGDDAEQAIREIKAAIGDILPFEVEVRAKDFMYPSEVPKEAPVARALHGAFSTMLGREPEYSYATAANDTGLLNVRGIQAINFGARDIRFQHTDHDLVSVRRVFEAAKVFAFLALHRP